MYIDTHCHLDLFKDIDKHPESEDLLPIKTISVTNAPFLFKHNHNLFKNAKNIRVALGFHPELVSNYHDQINLFEEVISQTKYIGEIGLDGANEHVKTFQLQLKVFEKLLSVIRQMDSKILTIHSRNAAKETIQTLDKHLKGTNSKVILHWYSGDIKELRKALDLGYLFSINHKMASSVKGKRIIAEIPIESILTETDAPFTFDNKITNRIKSIESSIQEIALIKGLSSTVTKEEIYKNFKFLLG